MSAQSQFFQDEFEKAPAKDVKRQAGSFRGQVGAVGQALLKAAEPKEEPEVND